MLRSDPDDTFAFPTRRPLPAEPELVIAALSPLLTDNRRARIEGVIDARTRSVVPVLDGLIDPHNIAAVLRSADAFGVQDVHVIERDEPFVASHRIAQGTERWLDLMRHSDAESCAQHLHARGYTLLMASMAGDYTPEALASLDRVAVVFGNEHAGVSEAMARLVDGRYTIPMRGFVESLNVSVANAITLRAATRGRVGDLTRPERQELLARFMLLSVDRADEIIAEYLRRR